jgi:hypothetical protein
MLSCIILLEVMHVSKAKGHDGKVKEEKGITANDALVYLIGAANSEQSKGLVPRRLLPRLDAVHDVTLLRLAHLPPV